MLDKYPHSGALPVTVIVPVKNEEHNLPQCLKSLSAFQAVLVVDSLSDDRTEEIANQAGATVIQFNWDGKYPKKRNWVLLNQEIKTTWVLFLDADEVITPAFVAELWEKLSDETVNGYWVTYTNWFNSSILKHGVPQRKLPLFRFGYGLFEKIEEENWSALDMEVHEHPVIEGKISEIQAQLVHNDRNGIAKFSKRHIDYALWEASRFKKLKLDDTKTQFGIRQKFKYRNLDKWWFAFTYFCFSYFLKKGFLDGSSGLKYAGYKFWYFRLVRDLIREDTGSGPVG